MTIISVRILCEKFVWKSKQAVEGLHMPASIKAPSGQLRPFTMEKRQKLRVLKDHMLHSGFNHAVFVLSDTATTNLWVHIPPGRAQMSWKMAPASNWQQPVSWLLPLGAARCHNLQHHQP